jgi:predicted GH43/DUF377 family glycosyl hydrolase
MEGRFGRDVIERWAGNPLIALEDMGFQCSDVMNAAVTRLNGGYLMLVTVEELEGRCSIYPARSSDGRHFDVERRPFLSPTEDDRHRSCESFGVRDARITPIDSVFYVTYVADGDHGQRLGLARTSDFAGLERLGYVSQVDNKNGVLFPRRIGGRFALLDRPDPGGSIWIRYSDDMVYWGTYEVVMTPRGGFWDAHLIGAAAPPIETARGWLLIYYGEKRTSAGPLVRLGAAILDRDHPARVVARSNIPLLSPREKYERIGDVGNVLFSCGALLEEDETLYVYYGASDSCFCLGTASLADVFETCVESEKEF